MKMELFPNVIERKGCLKTLRALDASMQNMSGDEHTVTFE